MWTDQHMDEYSEWLDIHDAKAFLALDAGAEKIEHIISYMRARLPVDFIIDRDYVQHLYDNTLSVIINSR